jgi:predicted transcriptional regulator
MTQAQVINALQNGPLTSHEIANLTGMPQATVLCTAKKLRHQGRLTTKQVKVGRYWVAQYTLAEEEIDKSDNGVKIICGIKTYGIFTKSEYAQMKAQATRLFGKPAKKEITNNQRI